MKYPKNDMNEETKTGRNFKVKEHFSILVFVLNLPRFYVKSTKGFLLIVSELWQIIWILTNFRLRKPRYSS